MNEWECCREPGPAACFVFFSFSFLSFILRGLSASAPLLDTAGRHVSAFNVKTSRRTRFRDASVRRVIDEVLNPKGLCYCSKVFSKNKQRQVKVAVWFLLSRSYRQSSNLC